MVSRMATTHLFRNPIVAFADYRKRKELKNALRALMAKRAAGMEHGLQFEGVQLADPNPENLTLMLVLQELVSEDRQFSLVQWPGGVALVRTAGVDNLSKEYQQVNEGSNFIVRGGSDKAADLANVAPTPKGADTDKGADTNKGDA
jgi:hypothetical protein